MRLPDALGIWDGFDLLQGLNDGQRQALDRGTQVLKVKRGRRIYAIGDPTDHVFFLRSGIVKIATITAEQREMILAFIYPGDLFGELAFIGQSPRDHFAQAHENCVLLSVAREPVIAIVREAPEFGYEMIKRLGYRLRTMRARVNELLCKSAPARLALALLDFSDRYGVPDNDGILVPLRLTQGDLAQLVGLSRETVNAILKEWRARGWVEADRRHIRLRQPENLRLLP